MLKPSLQGLQMQIHIIITTIKDSIQIKPII